MDDRPKTLEVGSIDPEFVAKRRSEDAQLKADVKELKASQERLENVERMASEMHKTLMTAQTDIRIQDNRITFLFWACGILAAALIALLTMGKDVKPTQPVSALNQTSQGLPNSGEPGDYTESRTHSHNLEGISRKRGGKSQ